MALAHIDDILIEQTLCAIHRQGRLAKSPGETDGGNLSLCAGALLVLEAARHSGPAREGDRAGLAHTMILHGSRSIMRLAQRFGLDASVVRLIVLKNDLFEEPRRVAGMAAFLQSMRRASAAG
jgi:hypothetical protein